MKPRSMASMKPGRLVQVTRTEFWGDIPWRASQLDDAGEAMGAPVAFSQNDIMVYLGTSQIHPGMYMFLHPDHGRLGMYLDQLSKHGVQIRVVRQ